KGDHARQAVNDRSLNSRFGKLVLHAEQLLVALDLLLGVLDLLLLLLDLFLLAGDFDAQTRVEAQITVGDEDQSEEREDVAAPIWDQQPKARQDQEKEGHPVAE